MRREYLVSSKNVAFFQRMNFWNEAYSDSQCKPFYIKQFRLFFLLKVINGRPQLFFALINPPSTFTIISFFEFNKNNSGIIE